MVEFYGIFFMEMAIGYKYIVDWMLISLVLIGGEEFGGIGYGGYIFEWDVLLFVLYVLEIVV